MLNINTQESSRPFLYRFVVECFGRSIELGVSLKELNKLKKNTVFSIQPEIYRAVYKLGLKKSRSTI